MASAFTCQLPNRGVIRVSGDDRRAFLQGLISNDINQCSPQQAIYAALLTSQGKFLHDLFIIEDGESFLIDCEAERADDLLKRLTAYKLRAKVVLEDVRQEFDVWAMGVQGSGLRAQGFFADPRLKDLGWRAILKKGESRAPSPEPQSPDLYDQHRLTLGIVDGSLDMIVEKSTLAEGNFDLLNGVSWTKGCYVGQELTARMHYRALVKKRLFPVKIEGPAPAFGSVVTSDGQDVGDMRSSRGELGLALLAIEKAVANAPLMCGETKLIVSKPEWMNLG